MISLTSGGFVEAPPDPKALRDSRLTLALNQSAHALNKERIQFVDHGQRRARGGYGEVAQAILHASDDCVHLIDNKVAKCAAKTCQDVAVKILLISDDVSADTMEKRFAREVYVWSQLRHENILQMLGHYFCKNEMRAWLVCPWVCGGDALAYLKSRGAEFVDRLRLLADAAKGLHYLHTRMPPICHGDIKAANVLINDGRAQLCDFGLASVVEDGATSSLATGSGFKGSIPWCSPELLDGAARTPQSDIWAWGWLVWEILTGKRPFYDIGLPAAIVYRIMSYQLPDVSFLPEPSAMLMQNCWRPHKERLTLTIAIAHIDLVVSRGPDTPVQPATDFRAITPDIHISVNSLPGSSSVKSALPTMLNNGDKPVASNCPGLPDQLQTSAGWSGRNLWQSVSDVVGCCLCIPCGSDPDTPEEILQDLSMAPLVSSDTPGKSERQGGRGTSYALTPPIVEGTPSALDAQDALVTPGPGNSRGVAPDLMGGTAWDIKRKDAESALSMANSDPVAAHDLVDVEPVPGVPSLFRGISKSKGIMVAIKVSQDLKRAMEMIRYGKAEDVRTEDEILDAFRKHISFNHSLVNPHINSTDGYLVLERSLGVVTPWCENGNIRDYMQGKPLESLLELLDQIFQGLIFLHGQHPPVIHGCLKPDNVLIDANGHAILSEVGELPFLEKLVVGITICGQVNDIRWLPPEVLRGAGWSTQSDVYTVGLLGQCIFSKSVPFAEVEAPAAIAREISSGGRPFHDSEVSFECRPVWDLLNRCLVMEPTQRPTIQALSLEFGAWRAATYGSSVLKGSSNVTSQHRLDPESIVTTPTQPRNVIFDSTTARKTLPSSAPKTNEAEEALFMRNDHLVKTTAPSASGTSSSLHGFESGEDIKAHGMALTKLLERGEQMQPIDTTITPTPRWNKVELVSWQQNGQDRSSTASPQGGATARSPKTPGVKPRHTKDKGAAQPNQRQGMANSIKTRGLIELTPNLGHDWPYGFTSGEALGGGTRDVSDYSEGQASSIGSRVFSGTTRDYQPRRRPGNLSSSNNSSTAETWGSSSTAAQRTPAFVNEFPRRGSLRPS